MLKPIQIQVGRGGEVVDAVQRLLRQLPDGRIGAEYMGLVYPLSGSAEIDLDTMWCYPAEAPICLEPPDLPSTGRTKWHLEELDSRSYLFLNGSADYLERAVSGLEAAGVKVEHWGPSFRYDPTGALYDWFVRLPGKSKQATSRWELDQILSAVADIAAGGGQKLSPTDQLARLQRFLDALLRRQAEAERQLAEAIASADTHAASTRDVSRQATERERRLQTELAFVRASLSAKLLDSTPKATAEEVSLRQVIKALEVERDEALEKWAEADEHLRHSYAHVRELQARLEELVVAPHPSPAPNRRTRQRVLEELGTTIRALLPEVRLLRDSAEFIITEVEDRRDLYGKLRTLSLEPTSLRGKRVHTADGWLEVHFSTGRARDGRLYYKRLIQDGTSCWGILVSDKAAQAGDISWLGG